MHTVVLSDLHLSEAQRPDPRRPHWMAYKLEKHFIDEDFARLLQHLTEQTAERVELVLNGDIFDFDSVTQLPEDPEGPIDWLARLRGLGSEEWMSRFKMEVIIRDHPIWFDAIRRFLDGGHRVVFVFGNHDVELAWPSLQRLIRERLGVEPQHGHELAAEPSALGEHDARGDGGAPGNDHDANTPRDVATKQPGGELVFCDWFYLSQDDTYISHGHQYDPNCVVKNPIDPLIEVRGRPRIRIPFGDLAGRYMLNGMGYFNPNAKDNYIMSGLQYVRFFLRYMLLTQPLLLWTWFWGALATLVLSLTEHWRPPMRDPLRIDEKVADVAARARVTPAMVRKLQAISVPSACSSPIRVMKVLWLDRGFLFLALMFLSWQLVLHINVALPISPLWVVAPMVALIPPYAIYAAQVKATVFDQPLLDERLAHLIAAITGARMVVFGHTHEPQNHQVGPVRYVNGGFWSAAFTDPECSERIGTQTFVWIRPGTHGDRSVSLCEWAPGAREPKPFLVSTSASPAERPVRIRPPLGER